MDINNNNNAKDAADTLREAFERTVHGISADEARELLARYKQRALPKASRTPRQAGAQAALERRRKATKAARLARRINRSK